MIINDKEYGEFDVYLIDDGTLDTVIGICHNSQLDTEHEIRFSQEYGAEFRDDTGAMTDDGFAELAAESIGAYIEQYLI